MPIDPARWKRLRPLLDRALDLDRDERKAFLAGLPAEDAELRDELVALLAQQERTDSALDGSAAQLAAPLVAEHLKDQADEESRIGARVGPYKLVRLLGSGGMGTVYLAQRIEGMFIQQVALKIVRGTLLGPAAHERFDRERQILAQLTHPNIAQLYDGGETGTGEPYYTMEYVDGSPLTVFCRKFVDTVEGRVRLLVKVAAALAHAHQMLVIHRDIKPSNILVTPDQRVKLVDFGIAKLIGTDAGPALTKSVIGPMTPEYAAPEQFRKGRITVATDVYQFGVLMFRLFTGRLPYQADPDDTLGWARAVTEEEPLTLARALTITTARGGDDTSITGWTPEVNFVRLKRRLAGDLDAIVRKALAKAPEERYRTMDALIGDLEAFLAGRPVSARRANWLYYAGRFVARHRTAVGVSAALALALVVAMSVALQQAMVARREADRAALEARRAEAENQRAQAAVTFVANLFDVVDPSVNRGTQLTADRMLARGAERLENEFCDQPLMRAHLATIIGGAHLTLGEYPQALALLEPAVDELRRHASVGALELARTLERAAFAGFRGGRPEKAEAWLKEALALAAEESSEAAAIRIDALVTWSTIERDRARPARALELAQQAFDLSRRYDAGLDGERTARVRHRLALVLADSNRLDEARTHLAAARRAYVRLFGEHWNAIPLDETEGWLLRLAGDLDGARRALEANGERIRATLGEKSRLWGVNLYDRGLVYRQQGGLERAQAAFEEAAEVWSVSGAPTAAETGWAWMIAAQIALERGDAQHALRIFEKVRDAWVDTMPPDAEIRARLLAGFAEAHLALGDVDAARADAERAIALLDPAEAAQSEHVEAFRVRAEIERAHGAKDAAREWYAKALAAAERAYSSDDPDRRKLKERAASL